MLSAELLEDRHGANRLRRTLSRAQVSEPRPSEIVSDGVAGGSLRVLIEPGLTRREAEVVLLVQQALSNRRIAEELVISERTVAVHVSNVLGKLELQSRTQLALWAFKRSMAQNGLASVQQSAGQPLSSNAQLGAGSSTW
jgi:NarL family two-component system response regulator LiaR